MIVLQLIFKETFSLNSAQGQGCILDGWQIFFWGNLRSKNTFFATFGHKSEKFDISGAIQTPFMEKYRKK